MKLKAAVEALYRAGRWTCGLPAAEEARLWEQVRDAAEIAPGTETARNDRAPAQGESAHTQCAPPQHAPPQCAPPQVVALPLAGPDSGLFKALAAAGLEVHGTTCRTDGYTVDVVRGGASAHAHGATLREAVQKACAALGVKVTWWVELEWVGFRDGWLDALKAAGVEARLESNGIFHASARRGDLVGTSKAPWASVALVEACRNCGVEIRWKLGDPAVVVAAAADPPRGPEGTEGVPIDAGLREVRQEIAELRRALSASVGAIQQAVSGSPDPYWDRVAELLRRIDQDGQALRACHRPDDREVLHTCVRLVAAELRGGA